MSDFYSKQSEIIENKESISEVETDQLLMNIISNYLEKNADEGVDNSLVTFINQRGDRDNVIKYISYIIQNNPNSLKMDDLFQMANLKKALIQNELNEINKSIEKNRNIDFEITGGTIKVKTLNVKIKGFKIKGTETENKYYDIVDEKIINLGNNKYKILLKRENSDRIYRFNIKYNGGHSLTIYDEFGKYIGRQTVETKEKVIIKGGYYRKEIYKTPGKLIIDTKDLNIKLNILFKN